MATNVSNNGTEQKQEKQEQEQTVASSENDETSDGFNSSSAYANNFDGHLPLHWLQPKEEGNTTMALPSFRDLQLKTHRTLYGTTHTLIVPPRDKSPKGSVDAPIQHLVDLINSHSRFCTLSSCSGRITLFDPSGSSNNTETNNDEGTTANNQFTEGSGKGRGSWVLVSHDRVEPEALVNAMVVEAQKGAGNDPCCSQKCEDGSVNGKRKVESNVDDDIDDDCKDQEYLLAWTFRLEPMLLHIAAASLEDGRRLLTIALNLGFRESGLVVTDKRVTVAIRSHSLATATPLFPTTVIETNIKTGNPPTSCASPSSSSSSLCVPPSFLRALVEDANRRLESNWKLLDRLYRSIESILFEVRSSPPPLMVRNQSSGIPALNLWNASAISIGPNKNSREEATKQEILIAGGYGCGPNISENVKPSAKRSSKLYKLEREFSNGSWQMGGGWRALDRSSSSTGDESGVLKIPIGDRETSSISQLGVHWWNNKAFADLQGMASFRWKESSIFLFWGGRKSPSMPASPDALYIVDTAGGDDDARIGMVEDIRGELPRPRWGHQLLALSGDRTVLLGGCNRDDGALDDVFVLHFCTEKKNETSNGNDNDNGNNIISCGYFYWERLSIRLPTPRFHFGAALLNGDTILVMGGLESTRELLQHFDADTESVGSASATWACRIGPSKTKREQLRSVPNSQTTIVKVETSGTASVGAFQSFFGMACCTLLSKNLLLITGGIHQNTAGTIPADPIQAYWISCSNSSSTLHIQRIGLGYNHATGGSMEQPRFDFGSLVHHCCIPIADNELLLVGGGVPSFAFGESYAR